MTASKGMRSGGDCSQTTINLRMRRFKSRLQFNKVASPHSVFAFLVFLVLPLTAAEASNSSSGLETPSKTIVLNGMEDWYKPQQISQGYLVSFKSDDKSGNHISLTSLKTFFLYDLSI